MPPPPDTKLGMFLASLGNTAQCRRKLMQYIRKWRLKIHTREFKYSDGNDMSWDKDAYKDALSMLYSVEPFLIYEQNCRSIEPFVMRKRTEWTSHASRMMPS